MYYGFGYDQYYPRGGAKDLIAWNEDLNKCITSCLEKVSSYDCVEVWGTDDEHGLVIEWGVNH